MAQSFGPVYLHVIFSTKDRQPLLSTSLHAELAMYLQPIFKECKARLIVTGGTDDHVHLLIDLGREISVAKLLQTIKANSSGWLRRTSRKDFNWQSGYGVFSVSPTSIEKVQKYIDNQEEHHRHHSFQEEFEVMLKAAGVEYDPKYLFESDQQE
jgi:putative transposase